jgi:NAD(P)-dependent dehydrogenase (short-subunit alcohol dehydrogenase family)
MTGWLAGKVALVTGAGSGIGRAFALVDGGFMAQ